jgi:ABC-2 type transport system permease protein
VKSLEQDAPPLDSAEEAPAASGPATSVATSDAALSSRQHGPAAWLRQTSAIMEMDLRKLRHDATELLTRAIQPALWLLIFGQVFTRTHVIPTGTVRYLDFMAPGVLAQSVLFIAIFYGIAIIWERDLGLIHKLLVSPAARGTLVLGKAISAGIRAISQGIIIYALAWFLNVKLNWSPLAMLGVLAAIVLGAALFATFSLIIACLVKTRERFMGIGQVLTMPLFFASNAIYPIDMMPRWLRAIAYGNPLTYEVDALRGLMIHGAPSMHPIWIDFAVLVGVTAALTWVGAKLSPKIV